MSSCVFSPLFPFCSSSTFKDAERASLRDSGHGDSDQADSDQDTNKGSHCDTSAREALKMKATAVNAQPFEQGEWMYYWHLEVAYQTLVADNVYAAGMCTQFTDALREIPLTLGCSRWLHLFNTVEVSPYSY